MKALLIDDDRNAVQNLRYIIKNEFDDAFSEIKSADSVLAGIEQLKADLPDVVFLDIQLGDGTGFDFLSLAAAYRFKTVFVTAYDEYAIRAIRLNAFDYLLKPVSSDELAACVGRLVTDGKAASGVGNDVQALTLRPDYIIFREAHSIEKIPFSNIYYLEASGPYTHIFYKRKDVLTDLVKSKTLFDFEQMLPADIFLRIHRSYIVNVSNVTRLVRESNKVYVAIGNATLPVSRRRLSLLENILQHVG